MIGDVLEALYQKVERLFAEARTAQPGAYACAAGCHRCCHCDLTVFDVEARRLKAALALVPARTRRAAARRARRGEHCALLSPRTHRCLVYAARPLICRAFGLPTLFEGEITWCPVNFESEAPRSRFVLDLDQINEPLARLERSSSRSLARRRNRISELVVESDLPGRG